jgi:hypothetical protein
VAPSGSSRSKSYATRTCAKPLAWPRKWLSALSKVGDAYKIDIKTRRMFRPTSAIAYDDRILSFAMPDSSVSIWTLDKRQSIPFVCGERQRALLPFRCGETDLVFVRGNWYLFTTVDIDDPDLIDVEGVLGIDLGVTNAVSLDLPIGSLLRTFVCLAGRL